MPTMFQSTNRHSYCPTVGYYYFFIICLSACLFQKGLACKSFNVNLFANLTSGNGNCSIFWIQFSYVCLFVLIHTEWRLKNVDNATVFNCHNRTEPSENREILSPPLTVAFVEQNAALPVLLSF